MGFMRRKNQTKTRGGVGEGLLLASPAETGMFRYVWRRVVMQLSVHQLETGGQKLGVIFRCEGLAR